MKTQIYILLTVLLTTTMAVRAAEPVPGDSLTITQAVQMTLASHPAIQQAKAALAAADARIGISESSRAPEVSLSGDYTRIGPVASIELNNSKFDLYPADNFDFHLGLRKTIYDFGRTSGSVNLAKTARQSTEDNIDVVEYNLAYRVIATCNSILILHKNIAVIQDQIDAFTQHTEVAKKRVKAGTGTDFDVLTTRVRIARARDQKIETEHTLERQEILLRQLTGIPADQPVDLAGDFDTTPIVLDVDSLVSAAEAQRPELTVAHDAEAVAAVKADIAALGNKPTLDLSVTTGFKNGYVPNLGTLKGNYTAGLLVHIPIYDGYRTRHEVGEAQANVHASREYTSDLTRQVVADVRQAVAGVTSSRSKIDNAEIQLQQAQQALDMALSRYNAGVITNLDLLDAQTALAEAKLIRLTALYDYTMSLVALDKATGKKSW